MTGQEKKSKFMYGQMVRVTDSNNEAIGEPLPITQVHPVDGGFEYDLLDGSRVDEKDLELANTD